MLNGRSRRGLLAVLAALVLAGCGTTVATTGRANQLTGPAATPGALGAPAGAAGTNGTTGAGAAPIGGSTPVSPGAQPAGTQPLSGDGPVGVPAGTHTPVEIGIAYEADAQQFGAALGGNLDTGDEQLEAQTVVDWVNAHGGLAGHPIKPVFFNVQLTSPAPYDQTMAEMCASWTQDHHAVAGIFIASNVPDSISQCLNQHRVFYFENGFLMHDQQDFANWPYMVDSAELSGDVGARTYVETLWDQGFFSKTDRIGVVVMDYPTARRDYAQALVPQLAKHGLKVAVSYTIHSPTSTPDISNSVADVQSAELKMRSTDVTKVLFLCYGCADFFMQDAQSQHWNPTYGLSTWDSPWYLATQAPAGQLANARAVGWMPLNDTPDQYAPPPNATYQLCGQILRRSGQATRQMPRYVAFEYCDALLTLRLAAQHVTSVSGTTLVQGLAALGGSYQSPIGLHTGLGAQKHWGVDAVRPMVFNAACTCFRYSGAAAALA